MSNGSGAAESRPIDQRADHQADGAVAKEGAARKRRYIPEGFSELDRLVSVRECLRDGQHKLALERLELYLDRYCGPWRAGTGKD